MVQPFQKLVEIPLGLGNQLVSRHPVFFVGGIDVEQVESTGYFFKKLQRIFYGVPRILGKIGRQQNIHLRANLGLPCKFR
jgi:hypothetical protein